MIEAPTGIDPILASVLQRRIEKIASEMALMLMRSSRSPIFNEIGDLVTVVFDASGRTVAQEEYAAIIAFGAQPSLKRIIEYFGDDIDDGDVIIHNDVYSGGNQNADVGLYVPVFFDGELVAWTASKGHMADIGGSTAGGYNPASTDVWQEALRLPPLKVQVKGTPRRDVWDMIAANIRLPIVIEDFRAMIGACMIGRRRVLDVFARYGRTVVDRHVDYIIDSSERAVRAEVAGWPDGVYHGESWMVSDGLDPNRRYRIAVDIEISGSDIRFDFSATDDQAPSFANMPPGSAQGAVRIAFLMLLAAGGVDIPTNDGLFAPVTTIFREGSLLNPRFPAATVFGNQMSDEVVESIMLALADALPGRITAGWNQLMQTGLIGVDPRTDEPFVILNTFQRGGPGAMCGADGYDAMTFAGVAGQMRAPDPELYELTTPHFLEYYEYLCDSAGAGEWRGGLGTRSALVVHGRDEFGFSIGDDHVAEGASPAPGLFGGQDGTLNDLTIEFPDGRRQVWGSKELVDGLVPGTRIVALNGGGGGYGDPRRRSPARVRDEVRDGLISLAAARADYGVAIEPRTWTIDEAETARLRAGEAAR